MLEYMDDRGLDLARATLLQQLGRFAEAGEVLLNEGRTLQAIHLFLKECRSAATAERASQCLLDGLRQRLSFGISPASPAAQSDRVLLGLTQILNSPEIKAQELSSRMHDEVGPVVSQTSSWLMRP